MKGLIIYIRREKLEAVQKVLHQRNVAGFSVENVEGCGCQKSQIELENIPFFPTLEPESQLTPKLRIYTVVPDEQVHTLIDDICNAAATARFGDGKIFVTPVEDAIRIRTKEHGDIAL